MERIKNYFADWNLFEKLWLLTSVVLLIIASAIWKSPWYGFVASITGMVCVVLVAKGRISNYWWGIVNVLFYAFVAYQWKLYGEVMLNMIYFLPMQFIGIYLWTRKGNRKEDNKDAVNVKFLSNKSRWVWFIVTIVGVITYRYILKFMGGNLTWVDSMSTVLSVIAMLLMAKLYMEQWVLWIIVDIVSIIMWFIVIFKQGSNDIGILIMWIAYTINAIYGFVNWIKLYKENDNRF